MKLQRFERVTATASQQQAVGRQEVDVGEEVVLGEFVPREVRIVQRRDGQRPRARRLDDPSLPLAESDRTLIWHKELLQRQVITQTFSLIRA